MRNVVMVVLLVLSAGRASAVDRGRVMLLSWELLEDARYGHDSKEHAAFLVADEAGDVRLSRWSWGAETMRAQYRGQVPSRAVAIVHTHPNHLPNPSPGDIAVAKRLGMPVYVITRTSLTRTDGSSTARVALGDWNPNR